MCILSEKKQGLSESWEEAPGLFVLFSFSPCAQQCRKLGRKALVVLPPELPRRWRRIAEVPGEMQNIFFNSVNFETLFSLTHV